MPVSPDSLSLLILLIFYHILILSYNQSHHLSLLKRYDSFSLLIAIFYLSFPNSIPSIDFMTINQRYSWYHSIVILYSCSSLLEREILIAFQGFDVSGSLLRFSLLHLNGNSPQVSYQ